MPVSFAHAFARGIAGKCHPALATSLVVVHKHVNGFLLRNLSGRQHTGLIDDKKREEKNVRLEDHVKLNALRFTSGALQSCPSLLRLSIRQDDSWHGWECSGTPQTLKIGDF